MGIDTSQLASLKEEAPQSNSTKFRVVNYCSPKNDNAQSAGIEIGNIFMNEGESGNLDASVMTDLGKTVEDVYILEHFQYYEWRDKSTDDIAYNSLQFKNSFAPVVVRDVHKKTINALPFWSKESDSLLNTPEYNEDVKRSNRHNIYIFIKIDGEWKRAKIKASASTVYGAVYDKDAKRPSPLFKSPTADSLIGFMSAVDEKVGKKGYYKIGKCKLGVLKFEGDNRRITFECTGIADESEQKMIIKEFDEFKEGVMEENKRRLENYVKEMVTWEGVYNQEYIAAYLSNPVLASYNEGAKLNAALPAPEQVNQILLQQSNESVQAVEDVADSLVGAEGAKAVFANEIEEPKK